MLFLPLHTGKGPQSKVSLFLVVCVELISFDLGVDAHVTEPYETECAALSVVTLGSLQDPNLSAQRLLGPDPCDRIKILLGLSRSADPGSRCRTPSTATPKPETKKRHLLGHGPHPLPQ